MEKLKLVKPTIEYKSQAKEYIDEFYKYNSTFDVTQILFKSEATNIVMNNEDIYFIKDNKLYLYDGYIKEVLKYDELSFNSTNRYAVYKKS